MLGREVRTLVNSTQDAGFKSVICNITNDYGKTVSAGVYVYQIQAGEFCTDQEDGAVEVDTSLLKGAENLK